jgi:hypothetical protein
MNKTKFFSNIFLEKLAFHGLDMEPEPEPLLVKSWNLNRNFSKVGTGTGTAKISQGSTTLGGFIKDEYCS